MFNAINTTGKQQSIGGRILYPGESRPISEGEVQEALGKGMAVPDYQPPAPEVQAPAAPPTLSEIQKRPIGKIKEVMPSLTDEQLLELEILEKEADPPRESLLKLIEKEIAARSEPK